MGPKEHTVFVYGTLLRGEPNHRLLARARFVGEAVTEPGIELADLGAFPAMSAAGGGAVAGEVYAVDAATPPWTVSRGTLDFYRRSWIRLATGAHVEAYLLEREQVRGRPRISSGNWRNREKEVLTCASRF